MAASKKKAIESVENLDEFDEEVNRELGIPQTEEELEKVAAEIGERMRTPERNVSGVEDMEGVETEKTDEADETEEELEEADEQDEPSDDLSGLLDDDPELKAALRLIMDRRGINRVSRNQIKKSKKQQYKDELLNENEIFFAATKTDKPTPITVLISGCERVPFINGQEIPCAVAHRVVIDKNHNVKEVGAIFRVYIPYMFLFEIDNTVKRFTGENKMQAIENEINSRIRSVIEVIPKQIDITSKIVFADRLAAMSYTAYRNYTATDRNGKPKIQLDVPERSIVYGRITRVMKDIIVAEFGGAECYIPKNEISYNRLGILNEYPEYQPGKRIKAKILSADEEKITISSGEVYNMVHITASIKQATYNPEELFFSDYKIGGTYSGIIVSNRYGKYFVLIENKVTAICTPPNTGEIPEIGQACTVTIKYNTAEVDGKQIRRLSGKIRNLFL